MLKHAKSSAAGASPDPAKVGGDDWNAGHIIDTDGVDIQIGATPAAPAAGNVRLFGKNIAGGALPAYVGPSGLDSALQPFLGRNKVGIWTAVGSTTTSGVTAIGLPAASVSGGSATTRNFASTNLFTSMRRVGYTSAATAGATTAIRTTVGQFWRGSAPGLGGFRFVARVGCSDAATVAGARSFYGLQSTGIVSNVDPSTFVNAIGIGTDSGDVNFSIMHNDASGAATKIDLGANFPDHTLSVDMYELALFAPPNAAYVNWEVTRLNTGHVASGTITTDLPVAAQSLQPHFFRNNGPTALAVAFDFCSLYIETDN